MHGARHSKIALNVFYRETTDVPQANHDTQWRNVAATRCFLMLGGEREDPRVATVGTDTRSEESRIVVRPMPTILNSKVDGLGMTAYLASW